MQFKSEIIEIIKQLSEMDKVLILPVYGTSMWPYFWPGTEVKVKKPEELEVGDIVIFQGENKLVIHRLIKIKNASEYIIKGDNLLVSDPTKKFDEIVAKVEAVKRKKGWRRLDTPLSKIKARLIALFSFPICYFTNPISRILRKLKLISLSL